MPNNDIQSATITPEMVEQAQKVLQGALKATKRVRKGKGEYEDVPDYKTQKEAAELIIAYHLGKPMQKSMNLNVSSSGDLPGKVRPLDVVAKMLANGVDVAGLVAQESGETVKTTNDGETIDI